MFKKILIANRGEIACRVAATARRMAHPHRRRVFRRRRRTPSTCAACDEAVHIGGSAPKDSYLRWERIIEAAQATGAQAIHPGYGFLSENEEFAQACADAGLVFIGPPAVGDPGDGPEGRVQAADGKGRRAAGARLPRRRPGPGAAAARGRPHRLPGADQGQRRRRRQGHARGREAARTSTAALASCKREASNSFGDDAVLVEKYVHAAAPHRDPGVRRHAGQLRLPVRARLLGAAAPPEGAGGSAGARHDARRCAQQMGEAAVAAARAVELRRRGHGGVHRRAARRRRDDASSSWR